MDRSEHARGAAVSASGDRAIGELELPAARGGAAQPNPVRTWLRAIRVHQWSKNVLVFVPLLLAHRYDDPAAILAAVCTFFLMNMVASATYILNDLTDLDADRRHPTKRERPIAAGHISTAAATSAAVGLGGVGILGALLVNRWVAIGILAYVALTVAYSVWLKAKPLVDVFILGILYTIRIVIGSLVLGAELSPWLLSFSLFFFFSMAMAKRHVEIVRAAQRGDNAQIAGRGYLPTDGSLTLSLGIASTGMAVMLLALYVANDAYPIGAYQHPQWLWAMAPILFLWSSRIWLMSHRALLDDDPIYFALRDRTSLLFGGIVAILFVFAII
jgi:4-hydroxybenzoate polyprenyltransferase